MSVWGGRLPTPGRVQPPYSASAARHQGGPLPGAPRAAGPSCCVRSNQRTPGAHRGDGSSRSSSEMWTLPRRVLNSQSQCRCCRRPRRPGTTPRRCRTTLSRESRPGPARTSSHRPGVLYCPRHWGGKNQGPERAGWRNSWVTLGKLHTCYLAL